VVVIANFNSHRVHPRW